MNKYSTKFILRDGRDNKVKNMCPITSTTSVSFWLVGV